VKFKINAGVDIETATPGEVAGMLDSSQQSWFAEMARGLKHFEFALTGDVTGGVVDMADLGAGPRQGFVWAVRRLSVDQLGVADVLSIYRAPASASRFVDVLTASRPSVKPASTGLVLHGGQSLQVTGTGLTTTAVELIVTGEAVECPEFMIWKLL
jgi:hypothetical protein